ncbi:MAG: zinc ribbon domain-containing protein [Lachnospiraceae bacterium]|nr:zinc ribbon domain-containing protein [Lachnospiraceae bacterium]
MRKCPKCGAELPDEALFCNECGEKLPSPVVEEKKDETADDKTASEPAEKAPETSAAPEAASETKAATEANASSATASGAANSYTAPIDNSVLAKAQAESKNSNIGIITVAAVGLLAVILVIVLLANLFSGGYEGPLKRLRNNFNKQSTDVESYLSCIAPDFAVGLYKDIYGIFRSADKGAIEDFDDALAEEFEDFFDDIADEYGDDFKLTYEIRDTEHLDDRDIKDIEDIYEDLFDLIDDNIDYEDEDLYEDLADDLEDYADISLSSGQVRKLQNAVESFMGKLEDFKIQDAYEVKVRFVLEGEDGSDKATATFYIIKVNGDWFIEPNSFLSAIGEGSLTSNIYGLLWYLY